MGSTIATSAGGTGTGRGRWWTWLVAALIAAAWGSSGADAAPPGRRLPSLAFEENRGQVDARVKFLARAPGYDVFLTPTEAVIALEDGPRGRRIVRMRVAGAGPAASVEGLDEMPGHVNHARAGALASQVLGARRHARVRYTGVRPGVDVVFHGHGRHLEFDLILAPRIDVADVALAFEGVDRLEVDERGDLLLHTPAGVLRQPPPVVYQDVGGSRRVVAGGYALAGPGRVGFHVAGHDPSRPLVIDPVLLYSSYLGGSGEEGDTLYGAVSSIAVDAAGNAYVTGVTRSLDFPTTPGADRALGGDMDAFVAKFAPDGALVYSTYLGGPCEDHGRGIAVDAAGNAYVTGRAHDRLCFENGLQSGALVAKLDPTGAVVYFRTFSGQYSDTSVGQAIAVDGQGNAYVTGLTTATDFPTTPGAYRTTACYSFFADGFVLKLGAAGDSLLYSTYLCGSEHESPNDIAIDAAGNAYVAGSTHSHDFPTVNALQPQHRGGPGASTGFVAKLNPTGSDLVYSTYLGGSTDDAIQGIAVDAAGNVFVTGVTVSSDFPTTPGVLQPDPGPRLCFGTLCSDAFVARIAPTGGALVYSTYLFGEGHDGGTRIAVDAAGHAYVAGATSSLYFPILDAVQSSNRGLDDAFVVKLSPDGTRLVYSTYLGGGPLPGSTAYTEGSDVAVDIAIDAAGNAHVVGATTSLDFPVTADAFQPGPGGGACFLDEPCGDAFVAKISAAGPGVAPPVSLAVTPREVAPGGTLTATWSGIPAPSPADELWLHRLGNDDTEVSWPATGGAAGTLVLPLPPDLGHGTYELRYSNIPPGTSLWTVVARSAPIRVGPAAPDLVVNDIAWTPSRPRAGESVQVRVTVVNLGSGAAGPFVVDLYQHRTTPPGPGAAGNVRCSFASLAAGAAALCTGTVTYGTAGSFSVWAQGDTGQGVAESNEANNLSGPRVIAVDAPAVLAPDLTITAVGNPPPAAVPGGRIPVGDTVLNQGAAAAASSRTRYYLSLDAARDGADTLLTALRSVVSLAPGAQSTGTVWATIPSATPPGTYHVLACADDTGLVTEQSETNNCRPSGARIVVGRPDLVETAVTEPPVHARPGTSFTVTDTVRNQGVAPAGASTTRYYLSADAVKGAGDPALTGARPVPVLAPGGISTGAVTVTIPAATPPGTYRLLACADDGRVVVESDEADNCLASAGAVAVQRPDLVQTVASTAAGPFRRGTRFTVSDTAGNEAAVATGRSTTTRYYLSADGVRSTGDVLLSGSRSVPSLAGFALSSGSASVLIPSTTAPGTYFVLACADDTRLVAESSEANNCVASATRVAVTP